MKKLQFIALACAAFGIPFLNSCATAKGFGQDLQKAGDRLENQANPPAEPEPDHPTGIALPAADPNAPSAY